MNKPVPERLLQPDGAFADYRRNTAARLDEAAEAAAAADGVRVGISRPHESAHLHAVRPSRGRTCTPARLERWASRQLPRHCVN